MAVFIYKVANLTGDMEEGTLEASEKNEAARVLMNQGFRVIHIEEQRKSAFETFRAKLFKKSLSDRKVAVFCRQIAILLDTKPLQSILLTMERESREKEYSRLISDARKEFEAGHKLYKALSSHEETFPKNFVSLIRAGEESGNLKEILNKTADYLEKIADAKEKFKTALIYPFLLTCVTFVLATVMFTFIIPSFAALFQNLNAELPLPTRMMIGLGNYVSDNGVYIIFSIVIFCLTFVYLMQYEKFKIKVDELVLNLPLLGDFERHLAWSRIFFTLALLKDCFDMTQALNMTKEVSNNLVFQRFLQSASKNYAKGHLITRSFKGFKHISNMQFELMATGEESGCLDETLIKCAQISEKELELLLKRVEALISPVLTLIIGAIVLFFALSVALPMFNLVEIF